MSKESADCSLSQALSCSAWSTDRIIISGLILGWILTIALVNPRGDFPINDDWVYGLAVRKIFATGHFSFVSPASANLFSQAYWGALFCLPTGFSFMALRVSTLVIAGLGIISLYSAIREVGSSRAVAALASLTLMFNPMYLGLANSFMTDVPFTALIIISFYLYTAALRRDSQVHLLSCFAIALAALGVRQYGLIFIGALCAGYLVKKGLRWLPILQATVAAGSAVALQLIYSRWLYISGQISVSSDAVTLTYRQGMAKLLTAEYLDLAFIVVAYVGAFTLPILLLYQGKPFNQASKKGSSRYQYLVIAITLLAAIKLSLNQLPRLGNVLSYYGLGPLTLRDTFILNLNYPTQSWPNILIWAFLNLCGALGAACILLLLAQSSATLAKQLGANSSATHKSISESPGSVSSYSWLLTALLISIITYTLLLAVGRPFDRYLLPLYPLTMILASLFIKNNHWFTWIGASGKGLIVALITLYAYVSIGSSHDYMAWNRARWQALGDLTSKHHVSPRRIDGGYEFNGWHLSSTSYKPTPEKSYWWVDRDDFIVASGPVKGYTEVQRYPFNRWLFIENKPIITLEKIKQN